MAEEISGPSKMMQRYLGGDEQDQLGLLQTAIRIAFHPDGCGCVGGVHTCAMHQFLKEVARYERV